MVNPKQLICTLDKKKKFEMELEVKVGRGFCPGDENKKPDQAIGVIAIDSLFSPVTRVALRRGKRPRRPAHRLRRLILEIWTDGRITPDDALTQASAILQHHLDVFVGYDKNAVEFEEVADKQDDEKAKLKKLLNMSVNEIELSVRAANCLNNANITTVGQLAHEDRSGNAQVPQLRQEIAQRNQRKTHQPRLVPRHEHSSQAWSTARSAQRNEMLSSLNRTLDLCDTLNEPPNWAAPATHRNAMLANLVCSLIKHKRVTTTLAKAKAARAVAEKMVTLGKERHASSTAASPLPVSTSRKTR